MHLIFDTETTGKAFFDYPPEYSAQPRLLQLGAALLNDYLVPIGHLNFLVQQPPDTVIEPGAFAAHGITLERCNTEGIPAEMAFRLFASFATPAKQVIAYNIAFDSLVMSAFSFRCQTHDALYGKPQFCAMKAMTPVVKLPGKWGNSYKWPKLSEAYQFCFGKDFQGAHDALSDVKATVEICRWLKERGL